MPDLVITFSYLAAWALGIAVGMLAQRRRMAASNAAHVECLDCTHETPNEALRAAQVAARAHRADTGHVALVVAN